MRFFYKKNKYNYKKLKSSYKTISEISFDICLEYL